MSDPRRLLHRFGRRIRLGMVGGGQDSVIGGTHLVAMNVDGVYDLVAGALSADADIALRSAEDVLIARDRIYMDWREMAAKEAAREDGIDAVVIATPPDLHLPISHAFLNAGIDVLCEKPLSRDLNEAKALRAAVNATGRLFCLTHCYTGYPMVRQARAMVAAGMIGGLRVVEAELSAGDIGVLNEPDDPSRRHWRFRKDTMGVGAILGEVGSHAHNIIRFVTGLEARYVSAHMSIVAPRREVYDNAYLTVQWSGGVAGRLWSSYVAAGNDHGLWFRIFGETGSLTWHQEDAELLWHKRPGEPAIRIARGYDGLAEQSRQVTRFRPGHPEGYGLAFANLYTEFAQELIASRLGERTEGPTLLPTVEDGVRGMALIQAAVRSNDNNGVWSEVDAD
jgi:predicted dehydrogenase